MICTAAVLVEVKVSVCVALEFTVTLPKFRLPELTANPEVVAAVPVPLKLTATVVCLDALLPILSVPVAEPAVVGWN